MSVDDAKRVKATEGSVLSSRCATVAFTVDQRVLQLGLTGVYFVMSGLKNRPGDSAFESMAAEVIKSLDGRYLSNEDFRVDPVLAGFRDLHTAVGRSNRDNIASPENLLRIIRRNGEMPRVNLLVDIYNIFSLKSRLALGAHDLSRVDGDIHLRLTTGSERFVPLGAAEPKPVHPGEYAYVDDANEIICRLETRQVEKTKVTLATADCFYIVQGNSATDSRYVWSLANDLIACTKELCGGSERILYGP